MTPNPKSGGCAPPSPGLTPVGKLAQFKFYMAVICYETGILLENMIKSDTDPGIPLAKTIALLNN